MPKPPSDELLARAAAARAGGASWHTVADQLHRAVSTVHNWPNLYAGRWAAAIRKAELDLARDAGAESVLVLRQLLRSDDEGVRQRAAVALARRVPPPEDEAAAAPAGPRVLDEPPPGVPLWRWHDAVRMAYFVAQLHAHGDAGRAVPVPDAWGLEPPELAAASAAGAAVPWPQEAAGEG